MGITNVVGIRIRVRFRINVKRMCLDLAWSCRGILDGFIEVDNDLPILFREFKPYISWKADFLRSWGLFGLDIRVVDLVVRGLHWFKRFIQLKFMLLYMTTAVRRRSSGSLVVVKSSIKKQAEI